MSDEVITKKDMVDAYREAQRDPTFAEAADEGAEQAEFGTPEEQLAQRHLTEALGGIEEREAEEELEAFGEVDADSTGDVVVDLVERIADCRREMQDVRRDEYKTEVLTARLDSLVKKKATIALKELMQEQEDRREDDRLEREADLEGL